LNNVLQVLPAHWNALAANGTLDGDAALFQTPAAAQVQDVVLKELAV
jgi:hypothetical protein